MGCRYGRGRAAVSLAGTPRLESPFRAELEGQLQLTRP